ncbi:MAG: glycosyltransferase [Opitutaceae bacterium]|nr:glycosyltransferase [Opitutaceae bacterium]
MAEISVIIPTHDRPQLVGRALASVLQQTFRDFEVVLVDNNRSTPSVSAALAVL